MEQLPLEKPLARRFWLEPGVLGARIGPVPLPKGLSGVAWQADLAAPAKFAQSRSGEVEILAEVPLVAERRVCEKLADAALDAAILWPEVRSEPRDPSRTVFSDQDVESALSQIPWGFRQKDAGLYQIDAAPAPGHAMRVTLAAQGSVLRVSTSTSVRACSPEARRALAIFAMESNRRLRLARIGVAEANEGANIVWDAVLPAALPAAAAIAPVVEAVVYAQMLTRRSVSVLADPRVANVYLRQRPLPEHGGQPQHTARARGRKSRRQRAVAVTTATGVRGAAGQIVAVERPSLRSRQ